MAEALSVWNSSAPAAEYAAKPHSAKSVKSWLETLEVNSRYAPKVWITSDEIIGPDTGGAAKGKDGIVRLSRGHEDCATVMIAVAKRPEAS